VGFSPEGYSLLESIIISITIVIGPSLQELIGSSSKMKFNRSCEEKIAGETFSLIHKSQPATLLASYRQLLRA
jgi:hypothetical protein